MTSQQKNRLKVQIQKAIHDPDGYCLHFIYITQNKISIRAVSPYRWDGRDTFVGLCLSRENPRSFRVDHIHKMKLVRASEVLMPFAGEEVVLPARQSSPC